MLVRVLYFGCCVLVSLAFVCVVCSVGLRAGEKESWDDGMELVTTTSGIGAGAAPLTNRGRRRLTGGGSRSISERPGSG
jgi:hypothetical protein